MGLAEGNRRAARRRRRRRRRQVACSRVGAWSGHGRLGAALRVVATLLRAGEPAPAVPTAPRARRLLHLRPAPPGPCIRTRRACSGSARTCATPAGWCLWHLYLGVGPRGRAPYKSLLGGDSAASVVPEERGLDQDRALTPFTGGETEAWGEKKGWPGRKGREAYFEFGRATSVGAAQLGGRLMGLSGLGVSRHARGASLLRSDLSQLLRYPAVNCRW